MAPHVLIVLAMVLLAGCSRAPHSLSIGEGALAIDTAKNELSGNTIAVLDSAGNVLVSAPASSSWLTPACELRLELRGLPAGAATVRAGEVTLHDATTARDEVTAGTNFTQRGWLRGVAALFLVFAGVYSTFSAGLHGGPAHGEHPMIMSILAMLPVAASARLVDPASSLWMGGLFLAAAVLSLLLATGWDRGPLLLVARFAFPLLYGGMVWQLLTADPWTLASRAGTSAIELEAHRPARVEILPEGIVEPFTPLAGARVLVFTTAAATAESVRFTFENGAVVERPLGN